MATTYTVDPAAAAVVSDDMRSTSARLQGLVNDMNDRLVAVLAEWDDDEAKAPYEALQLKWNTSAERMWDDLTLADTALNDIVSNYQAATRSVATTFS